MENSRGTLPSPSPRTAPGSFWDVLNPAERQTFMSLARERTFAGGATLMREGEPADHVIVILSGWTRISVRDNGRERVLAERGPGQLVGERAALQVSVRSASVVALETVQGLVMRTDNFAAFLGAHSDVLSIVEGQVYERLTQESAPLTPSGPRPAPVERTVPVDRAAPGGADLALTASYPAPSPAARPLIGQPHAFHGENCTVVLTDVVGFGSRIRNDDDRLIIRKSLLEMTWTALGELRERCYCEDRGDGILLIAPADIPTVGILRCLLGALPGALKRHNRTYGPCVQIQLRLASDVGPVTSDDLGVHGEAIIRAARLLEAAALKKAMVRDRANLGVVASAFVYDTAIGQSGGPIDPDGYARIHVHVKETTQQAWMKITDPAPPDDCLPSPSGFRQLPRRVPSTCQAAGRAGGQLPAKPSPAVCAGVGAEDPRPGPGAHPRARCPRPGPGVRRRSGLRPAS